MRPIQLAAFATVAAAITAGAHADIVLFDNVTSFESGIIGASGTATGSVPNTFMGDGYQLIPNSTLITGFDLFPANLSGTNFTGMKVTVYVWDNVNTSGTVNATTPAFSTLLQTVSFTTTGAFTNGFFYPFESASPGVIPGVTLTTPIVITDDFIGLTFNYMGTTDGINYTNVNSMTSLITYGPPATIGNNMFNGYYRNAGGETDGNFVSALRSLGVNNQGVAARVYGVPTPAGSALLGLAGLVTLRRRRN